MRKSALMLLSLFFISIFSLPAASAVEETAIPEYAYGTVLSISGDQLVLTEYDLIQDQDVEVTYTLDPAIELENLNSLEDLAAGTNVDVDYFEKDGVKTAVYLAVETPLEEVDEDMLAIPGQPL